MFLGVVLAEVGNLPVEGRAGSNIQRGHMTEDAICLGLLPDIGVEDAVWRSIDKRQRRLQKAGLDRRKRGPLSVGPGDRRTKQSKSLGKAALIAIRSAPSAAL